MPEVTLLDFQTKLAEAIPDATQAFIRVVDPAPAEARLSSAVFRIRVEDEIMLVVDGTDVTPDATLGYFQWTVIRGMEYTVPTAHTLNGSDSLPRPVDAVVTPDGLRGATSRGYPPGYWISPWGQANISVTPVIGEMNLQPIDLLTPQDITGLGLQISTAPSADARFIMCVYGPGDDLGLPGALLYESPAIDPAATTGAKVITGILVRLTRADRYWMGYVFTAGTTLTNAVQNCYGSPRTVATVPRFINYGSGASPTVSNGNDGVIARRTSVSSPLPNPAGATLQSDSNGTKSLVNIYVKTGA